jgi:CubicO group peptidase (beta-lactamase class C family)
LLLAQFIEQGLVDLDDPVGKYVPDFPTEGPKTITLRHCVTHTTGYEGHGMWGGLGNTWLDNAMASGLETLEPGAVYVYNGMGFDLAGKVMEVVSGKSIFRLMHEQFFQPLGHDNPTIEDLGYGVTCTVEDLARVGQLILNKGSYGDHELISRETFEEQVMPRAIGDFFPDLTSSKENRYNLGLHYWEERRPDVEPAEGEAAPLILGENTIGHGAASGAVLRVDYDHGLVVAVARPFPGAEYDKHVRRFLTAVADGLR